MEIRFVSRFVGAITKASEDLVENIGLQSFTTFYDFLVKYTTLKINVCDSPHHQFLVSLHYIELESLQNQAEGLPGLHQVVYLSVYQL